jgi:hypothetical protein
MLSIIKKTGTHALICLSAAALLSVSVHADNATAPAADNNPPAQGAQQQTGNPPPKPELPAFCKDGDPLHDPALCDACNPDTTKNPSYDPSKCPSPAKDGNPPPKDGNPPAQGGQQQTGNPPAKVG